MWLLLLTVSLSAASTLPETVTRAEFSTSPTTPTTSYNPNGEGCGLMCCDGRNNTCRSTGLRINGRGGVNTPCFCDEGCLDMGDCCYDYNDACTAVDCQMSNWTEFTECSAKCGIGTMTRERTVLVEPRFGGKNCPLLRKESKVCNNRCDSSKQAVEQTVERETAKIMPASYGRFRKMKEYNANMDIRKNLFYQYYHKKTNTYNGYCSRFMIHSSRRSCMSYSAPSTTHALTKGSVVCVECQPRAMETNDKKGMCAGHGEVGVKTNWMAIHYPVCQGWWERLEDDQECSCDQRLQFIFV